MTNTLIAPLVRRARRVTKQALRLGVVRVGAGRSHRRRPLRRAVFSPRGGSAACLRPRRCPHGLMAVARKCCGCVASPSTAPRSNRATSYPRGAGTACLRRRRRCTSARPPTAASVVSHCHLPVIRHKVHDHVCTVLLFSFQNYRSAKMAKKQTSPIVFRGAVCEDKNIVIDFRQFNYLTFTFCTLYKT